MWNKTRNLSTGNGGVISLDWQIHLLFIFVEISISGRWIFFPNNFHSEGSFHHMADGAPFQVFTCDKNFLSFFCSVFFNGPFRPLFHYFRLFITFDSKHMFKINFCQWLDLNCAPLVSEATTLPTDPQPLSLFCLLHKKTRQLALVRSLREWKQKMLSNNFVLDKNVVRRHNYQKSNSNLKKLSFY